MTRYGRTRRGWRLTIATFGVAAVLATALAAPGPAEGEIAFQVRNDAAIGSSPAAAALLPGSPPVLLVSNAGGLASFRYEDGVLDAGPRSGDGAGAHALAVGALGADRPFAVAYANRSSARVAVAPVDARGAVGAAELLELPALPRTVRIAGGGTPALFVSHDDGLSMFQRRGDGWQRYDLPGPRFAGDFAAGDVDADGALDLVAADESANQLSVLRGSAGFAAAERLATVRRPRRVVLADVNADRRADVLVIGEEGLGLHIAQAGGAFAAPQVVETGDRLADVGAAELTGDGALDLMVLDRSRSTLELLQGSGDGHFAPGDTYLVGYGAEAALLGDVDADGIVDALTINHLGDNATILRGRGGGVFDGIVCLRGTIGELTALAVADFDADASADLAVASEDGGRLAVFLGRGGGHFQAVQPTTVGSQPRALVTGDFNQDDVTDLAVVNFGGDTVAILQGDGRGGFAPPRAIAVGTGPSAIGVGSFSTDTSSDLAIVNSLSDSVSVLYGDGRGEFPNVATFPVAARPSFLIIGDTNQDGHQDLVVGSQFSESVAIFLGDGSKLASPTTNRLKGVARPSLAEDFDQDGEMDLVNPDAAAGVVEILPGTGPGRFGTPIRVFVGRDPHAVGTGDFDRDGRPDIAVVHRATQTVAILLNRSRQKPDPRRKADASAPTDPRG